MLGLSRVMERTRRVLSSVKVLHAPGKWRIWIWEERHSWRDIIRFHGARWSHGVRAGYIRVSDKLYHLPNAMTKTKRRWVAALEYNDVQGPFVALLASLRALRPRVDALLQRPTGPCPPTPHSEKDHIIERLYIERQTSVPFAMSMIVTPLGRF